MPGCRFIFNVSFEPLVDDRSVRLAPTPHRRVVDDEAPFAHELFDVTQAQGKPQIPANTSDDNVWLKVAVHGRGPVCSASFRYLKDLASCFATFRKPTWSG